MRERGGHTYIHAMRGRQRQGGGSGRRFLSRGKEGLSLSSLTLESFELQPGKFLFLPVALPAQPPSLPQFCLLSVLSMPSFPWPKGKIVQPPYCTTEMNK